MSVGEKGKREEDDRECKEESTAERRPVGESQSA
jgi:hypothetical protein